MLYARSPPADLLRRSEPLGANVFTATIMSRVFAQRLA
jgi:hypothetical protein